MTVLLAALLSASPVVQAIDPALDRWRFHREELRLQELWLELSHEARARPFALEHVGVVDVVTGELLPERTVVVEGETIRWVGPSAEASLPDETLRIDGRGKFLMPGLVDMHVHHVTSVAHPLLELACGVTTARDMCGFPWLLEWRELIRQGALLGPDLFVAGHILNAVPMEMYATVVRTADEARARVREQVEAGYDFIKVHNVLPLDVYRAICAEARDLGMAVVGHVPHGIGLAEAAEQGQHTFEHFKGYFDDRTLELSDQDYVGFTARARPWLCPTLATSRLGLVGEEAERFFDEALGMRYVSVYTRENLRARARAEADVSHARVWELSQQIFRQLLETRPRFLAGTDSGGYEQLVPGFALWDELQLMEGLGLPTAEVLRAATVHAAEALGARERQGTIAAGQRAHLLLLDANPLEGAKNVQRVAGVGVRGLWLSRADLDALLADIQEILSHGGEAAPLALPDDEELDDFLGRTLTLHEAGFVFMHHHLDEIADLLASAGRAEDAEFVRTLKRARRADGR